MSTLAQEITDEYDGAIPPQTNSEELSPKLATQLPEPKGYKLLIALPEIAETTEGGIIKSIKSQQEESSATVGGWVISMGTDAYVNFTRFPTGPYCKVGDWVVFRAFSGTRIKIHGKEFRLINDDTVEAVVQDPRGVERA